jgi:hypothetical protein
MGDAFVLAQLFFQIDRRRTVAKAVDQPARRPGVQRTLPDHSDFSYDGTMRSVEGSLERPDTQRIEPL